MRKVDPIREARRPGLGMSWHAGAAIAYLALATYGSLVPLRFQPRSLFEAIDHFSRLPWFHPTAGSRSDWAVNILLFVPLGYLASGALRVDRPRFGRIWTGVLVVAVASICAAIIEFAQEFFPPRIPSQNDVIALTIGAAIGSTLWLALGRDVTCWWRKLQAARGTGDLAGGLLPAYLALLVFTHVMPLDLATSPVELVHKYREGRIRPIPLTGFAADPWASAAKATNVAIGFAPIGWLAAVRRRGESGRGQSYHGFLKAFGVGIAISGGIEIAQLMVLTRFADSTDVLTGGLAIALGWWAGRAASGGATFRWTPRARAIALSAWAAAAIVGAWQPFHFNGDLSSAWGRLRGLVGIPFADYQSGSDHHAFDQILHKGLLFAPLGVILAMKFDAPRTATVAVVSRTIVIAIVLELGQGFLPGRYPSLTDVLVEALGGWIGARAATRAVTLARMPVSSEGLWTR